ncbi:MAG: phosphotransferase [Deltaproteobacteria bacterium]|nr:phosphotransferase [Deltaproteobacteria bacterium]
MKESIIRTAFILGAGLGTRLRPLTERCPKPLLPIGGRPLITYAMDHCLAIGVERFIVNTHHCAAAYDAAFPDLLWRGAPISFCHEPVLLDTAGGLKNIEKLLGNDETFLVYNGDILSDLPLKTLLAAHSAGGREVTLALRSDGPLRNVCLDAEGVICDFRDLFGNPGVRRCLFTGIYLVEKRFLRRLAAGKIESVVPVFVEMIRENPGAVASVVIDAGSWEDIGDVATYERIAADLPLLRYGDVPLSGQETLAVSATVNATALNPEFNTVIPAAAATIPDTAAAISDSDTVIPAPSVIPAKAGIQGGAGDAGEETAFVHETLGLADRATMTLTPVGKGGSDRAYFRVAVAGCPPAVLMRYGSLYEENDGYVAVEKFLKAIGISVPEIYGHDSEKRLILMEDLGDSDLYALRDAPWEMRRGLYEKTLLQAARLHAFPLAELPADLHLMPGFDAGLYRWERNYFLDECVRNACKIDLPAAEAAALEEELSALADRLTAQPTVLVHRDFQSQNVMIRADEPVLIDFQGLRAGSLFYDLGSLLFDPYVTFPEGGREGLLRFYYEETGFPHSWEAFRELFFLATAQRLMQALGAYGCLGLKRGKPHFLVHIRPALANLAAVAGEAGGLPHLSALVRRCRAVAENGLAFLSAP